MNQIENSPVNPLTQNASPAVKNPDPAEQATIGNTIKIYGDPDESRNVISKPASKPLPAKPGMPIGGTSPTPPRRNILART